MRALRPIPARPLTDTDFLPSGLTEKQKARKVSNLLAEMKNVDGTIVNERTGKGAVWRIA